MLDPISVPRQKLSFGEPPEKFECLICHPTLSRKKRGPGGFPNHMALCLAEELWWKGVYDFSHQVWCSWFHICLECRSQSTNFSISHKGNWSMYCYWISVSMRGRRVQSFLFCHLADVILNGVFNDIIKGMVSKYLSGMSFMGLLRTILVWMSHS